MVSSNKSRNRRTDALLEESLETIRQESSIDGSFEANLRAHISLSPNTGASLDKEVRWRTCFLAGLEGSERAYRLFVIDVTDCLRTYFSRYLFVARNDIDDLIQETLLAVHFARQRYHSSKPISSWIYGIAHHKLIDRLRRFHRVDSLCNNFDVDEVRGDADVTYFDSSTELYQLLDLLPDHFRLPLLHVKIEGMSIRETSKITGQSESAVKVGIHRGIKALARRVNRR